MRTLGVDLASQPKNTALCTIEWSEHSARVAAHARCEVHNEAAAWALSDHCPLVIDLPDG